MYIRQILLDKLLKSTAPQKVIIIYGPRRVGKTTLLHHFLEHRPSTSTLLVNGEDIHVQAYLSSQSIVELQAFVGQKRLLVIDEAQKIPHIGLNLKLLVDHSPDLQIVATGSSAFDLAQKTGEPLAGRKITLKMFPLSQMELQQIEHLAESQARLPERLIFGSYPEVVLLPETKEKISYLHELASAYLYKDILEIEGLRQTKKITHLLQLLALQVGKLVSHNELGQQLGLSKNTVAHYLDLLEKAFVLIPLLGFSRNLRKEITKQARYYFYDTGIRNALINQFNALPLRSDVGALWENYLVVERLKKQAYQNLWTNNYFWRTHSQQEIDWVEEGDGKLNGYEFKWSGTHKERVPSEWKQAYPDAEFKVIHPKNYVDFIT